MLSPLHHHMLALPRYLTALSCTRNPSDIKHDTGAMQLMKTDALKNLGCCVKCTTPSGGILTKCFPAHIPGSSTPPAGTGSMPPDPNASDPLPFPDIDSPTLDSIATADHSPSKQKWHGGTAFNHEKP